MIENAEELWQRCRRLKKEGMINALCMSKREFMDILSIHVSCHM